jgi:molecular chaperone DnaJ
MSTSTKRCYYEVLGVERTVSSDELRRAYKREALKHHPDRNQGDAQSEVLFKEVNEAYQVLSDDEKRSVYDRFGHEGLQGGAGFGNVGDVFSHMQDLFSEMFSGGGGFAGQTRSRRGGDLRLQVRLTLKEAAFGIKREVAVHAPSRCDDCSGTGAKPGTKPETCAQCRGQGHVSSSRGFVMFTSPCGKCGGQGTLIKSPCKSCAGQGLVQKTRNVTVSFPAGVDSGQRMRVTGQGMPAPAGRGEPGDLYVEIDVEEDARFERDGVDLITRTSVSFTQAALGCEIDVPTLDDEEPIKVALPAGSQPGTVLTVKGRGVPRLDGRGRGMLGVVVQVDVPTAKSLSARAKELLRELEAELAPPAASSSGSNGTESSRPAAAAGAK